MIDATVFFCVEEELPFGRRYDEGYDMPDPSTILDHPEACVITPPATPCNKSSDFPVTPYNSSSVSQTSIPGTSFTICSSP